MHEHVALVFVRRERARHRALEPPRRRDHRERSQRHATTRVPHRPAHAVRVAMRELGEPGVEAREQPAAARPRPSAAAVAHIAGVSVSATKPEIVTDTAIVIANCRYISPTRPPRNATGRNTAFSTSTIAMTRPADLGHRAPRRLARVDVLVAHVPLDVLEHDDRVVDDDADREHHAEQRQRVDREAEQVHARERADRATRARPPTESAVARRL